MLSQADIYRAAMRLIEQYGDGADIAVILRADPLIQDDERTREAVRSAIAEIRGGKLIPIALTRVPPPKPPMFPRPRR